MIIRICNRSPWRPAVASTAAEMAARAAHSRFLQSLGIDPAPPKRRSRRKTAPVVSPAGLSPMAVSVGRQPTLPSCSDAIPDPATRSKPGGIQPRPRLYAGQIPAHVIAAFDRAVASGRYRPATIEDLFGPVRHVIHRDPRTGQKWVQVW